MSSETSARTARQRLQLPQVLWALTLIVAVWMTLQAFDAARRFSDRPFDFDEAVHALPAYQIALDLRALDIEAFWAHSLEQDRLASYPFLHSWLLAPALVFTGADPAAARLANTAFVWLSLGLVAWATRPLAPAGAKGVAPPLAALFLALSLPIWTYANTVLLEGSGLVVTLAWLGAYLRARPGAWPGWLWLTGLLAAAAFFTKYSFGIFILGGMLLSEVLTMLVERRPMTRRWLALFGPPTMLIGLWLILPDKLDRLAGYSVSQHASLAFWSWENWLYAPINALRFYAPGPLTAGLMAATLALAPMRWREAGPRQAAAAVLAGLAALTWVPQKDARFLYTVAPLLIPPAAALAAHALQVLGSRQTLRWWIAAATLVELGSGLTRLTRYAETLQTVYNTSPDTRSLYQFVLDGSLAAGWRPRLLNAWYQVNALAVSWAYYERFGGTPAGDAYQLATQSQIDVADETSRAALFADLRAAGIGVLYTIDGSPAGTVTGWAVVEPALAAGDLTSLAPPVAQSPPYTLYVWPREVQERLLAGEISSAGKPVTFVVRLNAYQVQ